MEKDLLQIDFPANRNYIFLTGSTIDERFDNLSTLVNHLNRQNDRIVVQMLTPGERSLGAVTGVTIKSLTEFADILPRVLRLEPHILIINIYNPRTMQLANEAYNTGTTIIGLYNKENEEWIRVMLCDQSRRKLLTKFVLYKLLKPENFIK